MLDRNDRMIRFIMFCLCQDLMRRGHICIYMYKYMYIYMYIRKLPALHGFVSRVFCCTAPHCTWQAKNPIARRCTDLLAMASIEPHCTDLHGRPLARIFTDLPKHDDARTCTENVQQHPGMHGIARIACSCLVVPRGCTTLHSSFLVYI